jgi:uncharacterized sulfatase
VGRSTELVSTIDVVPTILSAAGLEVPKELPGLNLLDATAGKKPLARDAVFGEIFEHTAIRLEPAALNLTHRWVRAGDWKLILFEDGATPPELYQLSQDPHEEHDQAAEQPELVRKLTARVDEWWRGRKTLDGPGR